MERANLVQYLFVNHLELEEILMDVSFNHMEPICSGIEYGLLKAIKANQAQQKPLRIQLRLSSNTVIDVDNIIVCTNRVMSILYVRRNFFRGYLVRFLFDDCPLRGSVVDWDGCLASLFSFFEVSERYRIWKDTDNIGCVITDKNSKINGWLS